MKSCFQSAGSSRPLRLSLLVGTWALWLLYSGATASDVFKPDTPLGLPADTWAFYVPKNNPLTPAKVELGKRLFFEARLSSRRKKSPAQHVTIPIARSLMGSRLRRASGAARDAQLTDAVQCHLQYGAVLGWSR
jgi:hypothetical protein